MTQLVPDLRKVLFSVICLLVFACVVSPQSSLAQETKDNMVLVEGGSFVMGDSTQPVDGELSSKPRVVVKSFYIGKYEVTFDEFEAYCQAEGTHAGEEQRLGEGRHPIVNLGWFSIFYYCNWLSEKDGLIPAYRIEEDKMKIT